LFYYQEREEVDLASAIGKFQAILGMFGGEITREKQRGHMVDALRAKAAAGHVHSGVVFGYSNVRVGGHVERKIDPPAAKVVKRIFAEYVSGRTVKIITAGLNRDRALTPAYAGGWKEPKPGLDRSITFGLSWNKQTVRGVLRRPIYKGVVISRWASGERYEHTKPELQIIDPATWARANAMLDRAKQLYLRHTDGRLWGRPTAGTDSKYLLTGMLSCGLCGSVLGVESRPVGVAGTARRKRLAVYSCRSNRHGRRTHGAVCPNNVVVPMQLLDRAVINCISPYLTPDVIGDAIAEAVKRIGSRAAVASERARLERDLKAVDTELAHLLGFIKRGQASDAVQQELVATETRRMDFLAARDRLAAAETFQRTAGDVEARLTAILRDWADIRTKPVPQQRQLLRKLVPERIAVTPHVRGERKWVDWHGAMELAPIVSGITPALSDVLAHGQPVVAPTGFGRQACFPLSRSQG
jgi:site-specific DNA recombinase